MFHKGMYAGSHMSSGCFTPPERVMASHAHFLPSEFRDLLLTDGWAKNGGHTAYLPGLSNAGFHSSLSSWTLRKPKLDLATDEVQ